ncbi:hypothetical protein QTO34_000226 [Cnephaeus nilssonii]|uniref:Uncharacterized protein n=1 Tax=Cnephaeus nilssonii TaxID=3371016 RepID=A0AA40IB18_CNENI|nr:hypothetical protein QTO34_000226 [Eptesicus nilssonii]
MMPRILASTEMRKTADKVWKEKLLARWMERRPADWRVPGLIPVGGMYLGFGHIPRPGACLLHTAMTAKQARLGAASSLLSVSMEVAVEMLLAHWAPTRVGLQQDGGAGERVAPGQRGCKRGPNHPTDHPADVNQWRWQGAGPPPSSQVLREPEYPSASYLIIDKYAN